jgi:hypothetical protein
MAGVGSIKGKNRIKNKNNFFSEQFELNIHLDALKTVARVMI